ncbi:MAG: LacI family transcriptional regulator [Methylobacteriaceae bacterium]|nr:LacI family transcriptional regulator [Methylobacteriaceae bacterium]
MITIKDLSSKLGVSPSTVSRAVNGNSGVGDEMRNKICRMAEELGYIPNLSARQMQRKSRFLIGLIIPDIRNHFYNAIASVLAARCRDLGFQLLLSNADDDPAMEESQVLAMVEARVAGIVITASPRPTERTARLLKMVPSLQLLRRIPGLTPAAAVMDDTSGIRAATEHLLGLGHTAIGYVGTSDGISVGASRARGYFEALAAAGMTPQPAWTALEPPRARNGLVAVRRMFTDARPPTALILGSTEITVGGLRALKELGIAVPDEVSVIGYGDPRWYKLLTPALTCVRLPVAALAETAVTGVFRLIQREQDGIEAGENFVAWSDANLLLRRSTSAPKL